MQEFLTLCRMSRSPRVSEASRGKTQFLSQLAVAVRKLHVEGSDVGHLREAGNGWGDPRRPPPCDHLQRSVLQNEQPGGAKHQCSKRGVR